MSSGCGAARSARQLRPRLRRPPAIASSAGKPLAHIAAGAAITCGRPMRRAGAVRDDAGARVARALPARQHHRHRDHAGDQTAEKRDHEFDTGGKKQQRALAGRGVLTDAAGEYTGAAPQLAEADPRLLGAAVGQERVGDVVRLFDASIVDEVDEGRQSGEAARLVVSLRHYRRRIAARPDSGPIHRSSDSRTPGPGSIPGPANPRVRR